MNWEKLAYMLKLEGQKVINEAMANPNKTVNSVTAGLTAETVLTALSHCIELSREK